MEQGLQEGKKGSGEGRNSLLKACSRALRKARTSQSTQQTKKSLLVAEARQSPACRGLSLISPHHDAVNRFLTIAWRRQAQFGTLLHLVFSGLPKATRAKLERGGRLGRRMGRRGLANLEREIENLCCHPRGKHH
jgi:hypothetical protein